MIRIENSPCRNCIYRKGSTCTLLKITFNASAGVYKCYTTESRPFREFYNDLLQYLRDNPLSKTHNISRHLGVSPKFAMGVLLKLKVKGIVKSEKRGKFNLYSLKEGVTQKQILRAMKYVRPLYERWKKKTPTMVEVNGLRIPLEAKAY